MMSRIPLSPTILDKPKTMFSNFFAATKTASSKQLAPGFVEGEEDCLDDQSLHSAALTAIWKSPTSKVPIRKTLLLTKIEA